MRGHDLYSLVLKRSVEPFELDSLKFVTRSFKVSLPHVVGHEIGSIHLQVPEVVTLVEHVRHSLVLHLTRVAQNELPNVGYDREYLLVVVDLEVCSVVYYDLFKIRAKEEWQCLGFEHSSFREDLAETLDNRRRHISKLFNVVVILRNSLDADSLQRLCASDCEAVQSIALQLASLATNRLARRFLCCLLIFRQLFAARCAEQAAIRTGLTVRRDCEAFAADLAVLELSRSWSSLFVHLIPQFVLVFRFIIIIRVAFLRLLLWLAFGLLGLLLLLLLVLDRIDRLLLFALAFLLSCLSLWLRKLISIIIYGRRILSSVRGPFSIGIGFASAAFVVIPNLSCRNVVGLSMLATDVFVERKTEQYTYSQEICQGRLRAADAIPVTASCHDRGRYRAILSGLMRL
jgi:hypothetical protein